MKASIIGVLAVAAAAAIGDPIEFKQAVNGVLEAPGVAREDSRHQSEPVTAKAGALYGFSHTAREVGSGLIVTGSSAVNVDRKGPDAGWYEYKHAYQTPGEAGGTFRERFHLGNWNGKGEFSFKDYSYRELKAEYKAFASATGANLELGHGESIDGKTYRFDTLLTSFARNAARPLKSYTASFNTSHWNVGAGAKIVYRHALPGVKFTGGEIVATTSYHHGKEAMRVMCSIDGQKWLEAGVVTNMGMHRFAIPAALFPAANLQVRFEGVKGGSLQMSAYSLAAQLDRDLPVMYGETKYVDAKTGAFYGEVKAPVFAETPGDPNAQVLAQAGDATVWTAVSDVKIFKGTPLPKAQAEKVCLAMAANEAESCQVIVRAGAEDLADARVEVSDLVSRKWWFFEQGRLAKTDVQVGRVNYVTVNIPTDETGARGEWPDPIPLQDAAAFPVAANKNQPFWITVKPPKGTAAGIYAGTITVSTRTTGGVPRQVEVPFEVEVYGFEMPDRMTCQTAFGISPWRIAMFHRTSVGTPAHDELMEKYVQMMADHHLCVYHPGKGESWRVAWKNEKDPAQAEPVFDWLEFDDAHREWQGRFNYNAFRIPIEGLGHGFQRGFALGKICGVVQTNALYQGLMDKYLKAIESHLKEKGWLEDSYVYWFDEPQHSVFPQVNAGMLTLKNHAPGLYRMLTNEPDKELFDGVNLWCPRLDLIYSKDYQAARARNDKFWWYICCGPRAPYPTEFIDHGGSELRTWLWMTWRENITGILVWETTLWTSSSIYPDRKKPQNPYEDAMAWSGSGGTWGNGDGRFVYPPLSTVTTPYVKGQPVIMEDPVTSYRLEILRDGIEDYEYFALLKKKDPKNPLLQVPETIFRKVNDFTPDPSFMRAHRAKLAREIVRLGGGAERKPPRTCVPAWCDGKACSYREANWRKIRHAAKMREIAAHKGACDLVILGDSITENFEKKPTPNDRRAGADELAQLRATYDTLALGYGGDGIADVLGRIARGELDGYRAKAVAIMIGTNDKGTKPEDMAAGIRTLIAAVRERQPDAKIALYATFPCKQTWRNLRNRAANKLYAQVAVEEGVAFRDINAQLPLARFPDGLHPDAEGYKVWRADLEAFMKEMVK